MSKADGAVIIDTTLNTDGIKQGVKEVEKGLEGLEEVAKEAEDSLEDLGDEAEKSEDSLGDLGKESEKTSETLGRNLAEGFRKLGAAIAAAGVIDAVVDFGKKAISLASDLEEVQNVVDVTFKTMSDSVNKFAKDAKKTAGLSEKMAKQYVVTFGAMADSFGFTEEEAYEMSTALTQLTGDVASFYNLSQDEAMGKLKGVFTGETEALKELGVVMTQTALDAYAMGNGFGKTTAQMSEQEKVALRYQFVMDQLASASGDFVRTQDSWANQTKVLALQFDSLMATIGSGLIDALLPSVQFINGQVIPVLQKLADWIVKAWDPTPSTELAKGIKSATKTAKAAEKQFRETSKEVESNAVLAGVYKNRLKELEAAGLDSADAQTAYASVVSQLNELYPELNLQINAQTGLLDRNSKAQLENIDAMKQKYLMLAVEEQITAVLQAQGAAQAAVNKGLYDLEFVSASLIAKEAELAATTDKTVEEMLSLYNATLLSSGVVQNLDGSFVALSEDQMKLASEVDSLRKEQESLTNAINEGEKTVSSLEKEVNELYKSYGIAMDSAGKFEEAQKDVSAAVADTRNTLDELRDEYAKVKSDARTSIDSQVGMFDKLNTKSKITSEDIIKNWKSQRKGFNEYSDNLQKAIDMGLDETLVKQLSDGSVQSMKILNAFVNETDISVSDINKAFRKTEKSKETVSTIMAEIQTDMAKKLSKIETNIRNTWDDASYDVKRAIRQMQSDINSLKGKTVTIKVKTSNNVGISEKDKSLSNPSNRSASAASNVPYLASGAVIPPNAPFMAVLGDQRHGTNVEAPLSTIQEAVAAVMGDQVSAMMAGFNALLEENQRLRQVVEGIELGDTVIGQAADRYSRKMAIMRGV